MKDGFLLLGNRLTATCIVKKSYKKDIEKYGLIPDEFEYARLDKYLSDIHKGVIHLQTDDSRLYSDKNETYVKCEVEPEKCMLSVFTLYYALLDDFFDASDIIIDTDKILINKSDKEYIINLVNEYLNDLVTMNSFIDFFLESIIELVYVEKYKKQLTELSKLLIKYFGYKLTRDRTFLLSSSEKNKLEKLSIGLFENKLKNIIDDHNDILERIDACMYPDVIPNKGIFNRSLPRIVSIY